MAKVIMDIKMISIDNKNKFIREYEVTDALVHDSQVFEELLSPNTSRDVW